MNACIEDLNLAAEQTSQNKILSQELQEMSEVFYKSELVWNLCEIMFLEKPVGILPGLLEWIRAHFPSPVIMAESVLASPNPAAHDEFWPAVYGLVFQLRLDSAVKLMKVHPDVMTDPFQSACELLSKMPILGVTFVLIRQF